MKNINFGMDDEEYVAFEALKEKVAQELNTNPIRVSWLTTFKIVREAYLVARGKTLQLNQKR